MKIILCYPPISEEYKTLSLAALSPHLGLLSLAAYARQKIKGINIRIADGHYENSQQITKMIRADKPDLVGFSVDFANYKTAIFLADACQKAGAKVILGGNHASAIAEEILKNRPAINVVAYNDGEEALVGYLKFLSGQEKIENVPNLVWRQKDQVVRNPLRLLDPKDIPAPAYDLVDLKKYFLFQKRNQFPFRALEFTSQRGCVNKPLCAFCARYPDPVRLRPPQTFAREVIACQKKHKLEQIADRSPSFVQSFDWLKSFRNEIYKNKKNPFNLKKASFATFARADQLNNENTLRLCRDLNFYEVMVGYETGDDRVLKKIHKNTTAKIYLEATSKILRAGININALFVLGLPGENASSLKNQVAIIKKLAKLGLKQLTINGICSSPGSMVYRKAIQEYAKEKGNKNLDWCNIQELQEYLFRSDLYDLKDFGGKVSNFRRALAEAGALMVQAMKDTGGRAILNDIRK